MKNDPTIPVYIITGFLDSGKTRFLKYTMEAPYFNDGTRSLIIACEEGEEEMDQRFLRRAKAELYTLKEGEELDEKLLGSLQKLYLPQRVLIEYNGMWDVTKLLSVELPKNWLIYQIITILDGQNFGLYLNNIKMQSMALLTNTDMVIFNRCDEHTDLVRYQRTVRSVNAKCDLVFEDSQGNEVECPEPDLPYDIKQDKIEISDENFGTFFLDLQEHPDRYKGKQLRFLMQLMLEKKFPKNMFVAGRRAMTCCEADIRFLPFVFIYDGASGLKSGDFADITATLKWEYHEAYKEQGPVFYVDELRLVSPPENDLITF